MKQPLISGLHHVAIICSNYEISKNFYTEILGFEIIRETYRADRKSWKLDLRVNASTQIELFSFPSPPARVSRPEAQGLRHLAFRVSSLEPIVKLLKAKGLAVEDIRLDQHTGQRFTFFSDPDCLPLELYESN